MGSVYLAEDPMIGRRVAIKLIRLDDSGSAEQQRLLAQGFLKETRLAGVLHHPGVVSVYDAGKQDNLAYIVMEFVDGQTLDGLLRSTPRPDLVQLLDICRQAAEVLDYAHAHGVIHRDIKPTNVLVQHDGMVKICDFGIAKVMQSTEFTLTQTGMAVGTPEFMSPEQVLGQPLDGRSDQWSLAVLAYELVTGVRPFRAESYTQVMARIMTLDPEPACQNNPALPKVVDTVFAKALAKKAPDRFANCCEFVKALGKACASAPAPAEVPALAVPSQQVVAPTVPQPATVPAVPQSVAATPAAPTPAAALPAAVETEPVSEPFRKAGPNWKLIATAVIVLVAGGGAAALMLLRHTPPVVSETVQPPVSSSPPPRTVRVPADRPRVARPPSPAAKVAESAPSRPAASATPAPAVYSERLTTVPDAVDLIIDNKSDAPCQSPCNVELTAGKHSVQAMKQGFYPLAQEFQVNRQQPQITFTLQQIIGTAIVQTDPPGASISVNGKPRSETTPAHLQLPMGEYKVTLTKEGFVPIDYDLTVHAGLISVVKATLAKSSH
jgi:serine/threonine protein kinase